MQNTARSTKPLFALTLATALLAASLTQAAIVTIQQDDFEAQTPGADLDGSGTDISGWSWMAGAGTAADTGDDITIADSGSNKYIDVHPATPDYAPDWVFFNMDTSVAFADIDTKLVLEADARMVDSDANMSINIGLDNKKRYAITVIEDGTNDTIELFARDKDNGNRNEQLDDATGDLGVEGVLNYELHYTPSTNYLEVYVDDSLLLSATDSTGIDFTGDDMFAIFGAGDGQNFTLDNVLYTNGVIPEPASAALLLLGVAALCARRRRR